MYIHHPEIGGLVESVSLSLYQPTGSFLLRYVNHLMDRKRSYNPAGNDVDAYVQREIKNFWNAQQV